MYKKEKLIWKTLLGEESVRCPAHSGGRMELLPWLQSSKYSYFFCHDPRGIILVADLGIISVMLIFQPCKIKELWNWGCHRTSTEGWWGQTKMCDRLTLPSAPGPWEVKPKIGKVEPTLHWQPQEVVDAEESFRQYTLNMRNVCCNMCCNAQCDRGQAMQALWCLHTTTMFLEYWTCR